MLFVMLASLSHTWNFNITYTPLVEVLNEKCSYNTVGKQSLSMNRIKQINAASNPSVNTN